MTESVTESLHRHDPKITFIQHWICNDDDRNYIPDEDIKHELAVKLEGRLVHYLKPGFAKTVARFLTNVRNASATARDIPFLDLLIHPDLRHIFADGVESLMMPRKQAQLYRCTPTYALEVQNAALSQEIMFFQLCIKRFEPSRNNTEYQGVRYIVQTQEEREAEEALLAETEPDDDDDF